MKRLISMLLVVVMIVASLAACDKKEAGTGEMHESGKVYSIAGNNFGAGAYPLDIIGHAEQKIVNITGAKLDIADNQFTADKIVTDLESQLATSPDGVLMLCLVDAVFGTVKEKCNEAKVPYVLDTNLPTDQALLEEIKNDPLFIGAATADQYKIGAEIANVMLNDGITEAVILAAAVGDYSHDTRIKGFTETYEANGGTVVQVMHCSDPSEATTKANDLLMANPDIPAVYATGGDYLSALVAIKTADASAKYALYGTDIAPDLIEAVEAGVISCMNGGQHLCGAMVMCMLINYLDGHQILDENGKVPFITDFPTYTITTDNAAGFKVLYAEDSCFITEEEFKVLLHRYNPDVDFATYRKFTDDYDDTIYAKAEAALK